MKNKDLAEYGAEFQNSYCLGMVSFRACIHRLSAGTRAVSTGASGLQGNLPTRCPHLDLLLKAFDFFSWIKMLHSFGPKSFCESCVTCAHLPRQSTR